MPTTIQISDETLELLRRMKAQLKASSYDETIHRMFAARTKSFAGILGKHLTEEQKRLFAINDRDKTDRF